MEQKLLESGHDSVSEESGSAELFDFFCEPCDLDSRHVQAKGYCKNCKQFLCLECFNFHRRPMPTRHHVLLDEKQMPRNIPPTPSVSKCTEKCFNHPGELLQYFCDNHKQLGCQMCMSTDHKLCDDVNYIPALAKSIDQNRECSSLLETLDHLEKSFKTTKASSKTKLTNINKNASDVLGDIDKFRKDINLYLDKLQVKLRSEVSDMKTNKVESMQSISKESEDAMIKIKTIRSQINDVKSSDNQIDLFVAIHKDKQQIRSLEILLETLENKTQRSTFVLEREEKIMSSWHPGIIRLGKVVEKPVKRQMTETKTIKVKLSTDEEFVKGMAVLSMKHVVVIDGSGSLVYVVNTDTGHIESELDLESTPFGITKLSDSDDVAVTVPEKKQIVLLHVHKTDSMSLSKTKTIAINEKCQGIAFKNDKFVVACNDKVLILDMNGKILKCFSKHASGEPLFTCALHVAISHNNDFIYVSEDDGTITHLTTEKPLYKFRKNNMTSGITCDQYGNVFICSGNVHEILQTTPHLTHISAMANKTIYPWSVACSESNNTLFVGQYRGIRMFEFK